MNSQGVVHAHFVIGQSVMRMLSGAIATGNLCSRKRINHQIIN